LIGAKTMRDLGMSINLELGLVTLRNSDRRLPIIATRPQASKVMLLADITLPPRTETLLSAGVKQSSVATSVPIRAGDSVVVERTSMFNRRDAHIAGCCATVSSDHTVPVLFLNTSPHDVILRAGTLIAIATHFDSTSICAVLGSREDSLSKDSATRDSTLIANVIASSVGGQGRADTSAAAAPNSPSTGDHTPSTETTSKPPDVTVVDDPTIMVKHIERIEARVARAFNFITDEKTKQRRKRELTSILMRHLPVPGPKLGCAPGPLGHHTIKLKDPNAAPLYIPQYRLSATENNAQQQEIEKLLAADIIEPVSAATPSLSNSPTLMIPKRTGKWRMVIDLRRLNGIIEPMHYALPSINTILDSFGTATMFSTLDITQAFHNLSLTPRSRPLTAFTSSNGRRYQYRRLVQGLASAPSAWQAFIESVLINPSTGLTYRALAIYLDDIILFHSDADAHLRDLQTILQVLQANSLTLNLDKCVFASDVVDYLGHRISSGATIQPLEERVKAIAEFPVPKSRKALKRFIGMCTYYTTYMPAFSSIAAPLHCLASQRTSVFSPYVWTPECDISFRAIKHMLTNKPCLRSPDYSKPFILQCDASGYGVGHLLMQEDTDGSRYLVRCGSKTLDKVQRRWSATEREAYAILVAVRACRPYVFGTSFLLESDHKALEQFQSPKDPHGKLNRWSMSLREYDFTVRYKRGAEMVSVDALSRAGSQEPGRKIG
jgi:hypothetical protein